MSYTLPTLPDDQQLSFYRIVWEIVRQVPEGKVTTFGQIASMIPTPAGVDPEIYTAFGAQWVGQAMNAVTRVDEKTVPWHRVINSKGGIAMADSNPSSALQRGRLRAENIEFNHKELVDFELVGWDGPDEDWIVANGLIPPRSIKKVRKTKSKPKPPPPPIPLVDDDDDDYDPDDPQQLLLF